VLDTLPGILERVVVGSVAITARAITAAEADLTVLQWRVLLVVGEPAEGVTVGEIATRIGAHASPASRIVSRLRRRGLVQAVRDASDARVVRVTLTDSGRALRRRVLEQRSRDLSAVVAGASLTSEQVEAVGWLARAFERFV
jgi:DNA-binding MarR family transcriptional regulator